jgi:hypothetical protein
VDIEGLQAGLEKELLSENEPRSLAAVAKSLGYPVQILKRFFPAVCQQIIAREKLHRKKRRELRQQKIQEAGERYRFLFPGNSGAGSWTMMRFSN